MAFGGVAFFATGYALASSPSGGPYIGTSYFFLDGVTDFPDWIFKYAFSVTAATIISGAVAGRMRFTAYLCMSLYVTGIVYPLGARWGWHEDGWLAKMGYHDFAGVGPIHLRACAS